MKRTITTTEISCDICTATNIVPAKLIHREVFGYRSTNPFGVDIQAVTFGDYCEHVCVDCAMKAFHAAISNPET